MSYKLPVKKKQAIIIIHVLSVVCWLGGALVMLLLGMYMLQAENLGPAVLHIGKYA